MADDDDPLLHGQPQSPVIAGGRDRGEDVDGCVAARETSVHEADEQVDHDGDCATVGRVDGDATARRWAQQLSTGTDLSTTHGSGGANESEDDSGGGDPTPLAPALLSLGLRELVDDVTSVRSALAGPTVDNAVLPIRAWGHRMTRTDETTDVDSLAMTPRLIPMAAPTGQFPHATPTEAGDSDGAALLRVVGFDDGVYRGQVKRCAVEAATEDAATEDGTTPERFVPHGWGIATSLSGLRRVGQWHNGDQVGVGALQSAVFVYDGEWHATTGPSGYGIGTFAFGATFVGCWHNGKPYGLGRLQLFETNRFEYGWFYGTRCLQALAIDGMEEHHADCLKCHIPAARFDDQPQRGLFLVGHILEDARLSSLRFALEQWRRAACNHAIQLARTRRAAAMAAWTQAHAAERDALAWHISNEMQMYRSRMTSVLDQVTVGRQHYARVQRIRDFHTNRLSAAIFQRDLARRCVVSQEESIALMESELNEVATLLDEATHAQSECQRLAAQQQAVKRQIENAQVQINTLQQQIRRRDKEGGDQQQQEPLLHLQTPATPPSPTQAILGSRSMQRLLQPNRDVENREPLPYVCDVADCSCGIPRHVFTSVATVLNGE